MKNRKNLTSFKKVHQEWMKNDEFRQEYKRFEPEFQIARQVVVARLK